MPELRFDSLRREWVAYATERNDRTFLPKDFCPLCPSGPGGRSEVPLDTLWHDPRFIALIRKVGLTK